ncbi:MAG: hypothetical protein PVH63_09110 [Balneolaceae bacterium]|jgi:hypothetical protein
MKFLTTCVAFFTVLLLIGVACTYDPAENVLEYRLTINNKTNTGYDVYQSSNVTTGGTFSKVGSLSPLGSITVRRLVIDVEYTFRIVQGENVDQPDFEQIIQSNGDNITWNLGDN